MRNASFSVILGLHDLALRHRFSDRESAHRAWRPRHLGGSNGATAENAHLISQKGMEVVEKFFS
jgi:hypothetical protein